MLDIGMLLVCLAIFFQTVARTHAIKNSEELPWNLGREHSSAWTGYLVTLIAGIILNGFSLYLIKYKKRVQKICLANLIFSLNSIDLTMSLFCFHQCLLNMLHKEQYGHRAGCEAQALLLGFFEFWEAFTLALIAFCLERKVCAGIEFTNSQVLSVVLKSGLFSFVLSACACYLPYAGYHLYPSGTFCFFNLSKPITGFVFAAGIVIPTVIMAQRYMRIWNCVQTAQAVLAGKGLEIKAKARYTQMAKKMSLFILTFFGCAAPYLCCAIYEWVTGEYTTPWVDEVAGITLHLVAVINPILFFVFNEDVSDLLWQEYGINIAFWRKKSSNSHQVVVRQAKVHCNTAEDLQTFRRSTEPSMCWNDPKEWKIWMNQENLSKIFLFWSKQHYVMENLMFYQEIVKFKEFGNDVKWKITPWLNAVQDLDGKHSCSEAKPLLHVSQDPVKMSLPSEIREAWHVHLYEMTSHIYALYINIPKAPLEINIPALTHNRILEKLGFTATEKQAKSDAIPTFPDVWLLPVNEATEQLHKITQVYDEAFKHICSIIEQDIFPRFKNSADYQFQTVQQADVC